MDSPRMETRTHAFRRQHSDAPPLVEMVNKWEVNGWTVKQLIAQNNLEWVVVFERPKDPQWRPKDPQ